jgi:hypothetical protein
MPKAVELVTRIRYLPACEAFYQAYNRPHEEACRLT